MFHTTHLSMFCGKLNDNVHISLNYSFCSPIVIWFFTFKKSTGVPFICTWKCSMHVMMLSCTVRLWLVIFHQMLWFFGFFWACLSRLDTRISVSRARGQKKTGVVSWQSLWQLLHPRGIRQTWFLECLTLRIRSPVSLASHVQHPEVGPELSHSKRPLPLHVMITKLNIDYRLSLWDSSLDIRIVQSAAEDSRFRFPALALKKPHGNRHMGEF